jgi:molecular chaperone GrpE
VAELPLDEAPLEPEWSLDDDVPPALKEALDDFRSWYEEELAGEAAAPLPPAGETIDLATLLGHFVALRQEVNFQTRSVRAQQEQTATFLDRIEDDLANLSRAAARPEPVAGPPTEQLVRPLLKAVVDLYDALSVAGQQIQRVQATVVPLLDDVFDDGAEEDLLHGPAPGPAPPTRPFWSRWFLSPTADAALRASNEQTQTALVRLQEERLARAQHARQARESVRRIRDALEALVSGYTMSLERIDRALRQHGLEPIPAVGARFEPEQMEALEPVFDSGRPSGEVVEEVRRGYLQNGRVFREAQVRVARDRTL